MVRRKLRAEPGRLDGAARPRSAGDLHAGVGFYDNGAGNGRFDGQFRVIAEKHDSREPLKHLDDRPGCDAEGRQPSEPIGILANHADYAPPGARVEAGKPARPLRMRLAAPGARR